jgi:hypothetical protein
MAWYRAQTEWSEGHSYGDPSVCSAALQRWFSEIAKTFPPMNGPLATEDVDDPRVTDHCCGRNVIYSAFASSVGASAYEALKALAMKHKVGFFAASESDGELVFPAAE